MGTTIAYILIALTFFYYLGVVIAVTRLAVRSGRLKSFRDISPEDITVLFDGLNGVADHRQLRGRRESNV